MQTQSGLLHRPTNLLVDTEIDQIVTKLRTQKELGRQIANNFGLLLLEIRLDRIDPVVQQSIPNRIRQRHVEIVLGGDERKFALDIEKVIGKGSFKGFYGQGRVRTSSAGSLSSRGSDAFVPGASILVDKVRPHLINLTEPRTPILVVPTNCQNGHFQARISGLSMPLA